VAVFHGFRLYAPQHLSSAEMFRRVLSASSVGTFLLLVIAVGTTPALSRAWMGLTWAVVIVFELATRRFWNWWLYRLRTSRRLAYRTLIIGTNEEARRLFEIMEDSSYGYEPIGNVAPPGLLASRSGLTILGRLETLAETIERYSADCIFVASTAVTVDQMSFVQRIVRRSGIELRVSANLPEILSSRLTVKPVGDVMAISLRPVTLTGTQAIVKRSFDLVLASIGLLLMLPIIAVVALLIRITSPGPVIFRQERVSRGGRSFTVYKFRTMVHNADSVFDAGQVDRTEAFFKHREPGSITPVGKILRRLSLDELPQLWNIVKGDMSIVGPRPLPAEQVAANLELLEPRHEVRAGLTGWWQINGRSDVDPIGAVRMDLFYIENWSLTLDLYIVLKTFGVLIAGKGAY
jgi:exopolysaccharide biosynthesis polyprenyl glycosylphosphotransferase